MNTLIEKIQSLLDKWRQRGGVQEDIPVIDGWMKEAKRLMLIKSLKDHDGVRYVLEIFQAEIKKANSQLRSAYSKDLSDKERDRLLDKRELAEKYVRLFVDVEGDLEKLEEVVDKELERI